MNSNNKFLSQLLVSFLEFAEKGNGIKEASVLGQFEKACYEKITDQIRSSQILYREGNDLSITCKN